MTQTVSQEPTVPEPDRPLRVVILSKPHPLTHYLEGVLAARGCLSGILYEQRLDSLSGRVNYARGFARREGWKRLLDVAAYGFYEALFRQKDVARAAEQHIPPNSPEVQSLVPEPHIVRSLNSSVAQETIRDLDPDVLIVHATGILKAETYGLARLVSMNIHCGVLPNYRGHSSTFWALHENDVDNIGVTIHEIARLVDTGGPLRVGRVPLDSDDDDITMWYKSFVKGVELVEEILDILARGESLERQPTVEDPGPHFPRRGLSDHLAWLRRSRKG